MIFFSNSQLKKYKIITIRFQANKPAYSSFYFLTYLAAHKRLKIFTIWRLNLFWKLSMRLYHCFFLSLVLSDISCGLASRMGRTVQMRHWYNKKDKLCLKLLNNTEALGQKLPKTNRSKWTRSTMVEKLIGFYYPCTVYDTSSLNLPPKPLNRIKQHHPKILARSRQQSDSILSGWGDTCNKKWQLSLALGSFNFTLMLFRSRHYVSRN